MRRKEGRGGDEEEGRERRGQGGRKGEEGTRRKEGRGGDKEEGREGEKEKA